MNCICIFYIILEQDRIKRQKYHNISVERILSFTLEESEKHAFIHDLVCDLAKPSQQVWKKWRDYVRRESCVVPKLLIVLALIVIGIKILVSILFPLATLLLIIFAVIFVVQSILFFICKPFHCRCPSGLLLFIFTIIFTLLPI